MRDVFYTLLVIWIIWRIIDALSTTRARSRSQQSHSEERIGDTTISYTPPSGRQKKKFPDDGEYVDYEEIK
jgi:hypothetical protein